MAARKQRWHPEEVRKRIQASQLINRLNDHALSQNEVKMDATQIQAARILLGKVLPDLASTTIAGDADKPIAHKLTIEFKRPGDYQAVYDAHRSSASAYKQVQSDYRSRKIGDKEYLEGRKKY